MLLCYSYLPVLTVHIPFPLSQFPPRGILGEERPRTLHTASSTRARGQGPRLYVIPVIPA